MNSDQYACLLVHGYAGRPFEMSFLDAYLRARGVATRVPVLAGHDDNPEAFAASRFEDWLETVDAAYAELAVRHDRVVLVGFSLGGTLALALAQKRPVAAVVSISAPVFLARLHPYWAPDARIFASGLMRHAVKRLPCSIRSAESKRIAPWIGYEGVHYVEPLHSFKVAAARVRRNLKRITAPLLVLHGARDRSVHPDNAWAIMAGVSSVRRDLHLLSVVETLTSGHMLPTHEETREPVGSLVFDFCQSL